MALKMDQHFDMLWSKAELDTFQFWCHLMVLGPDQSKSQSFFSYWVEPETNALYIMIDFLACIRTMSLDPFYQDEWPDKLIHIQPLLLYWFKGCSLTRTRHEFPPLEKGSKGILIPDHILFKFMTRLWKSHQDMMVDVMQKTNRLTTPPSVLSASQMAMITSNHWCKLFRSSHFKLSGRELPATYFGPMFSHVSVNKARQTTQDRLKVMVDMVEPLVKSLKRKSTNTLPYTPIPRQQQEHEHKPLPPEPLVPIHLLLFPSRFNT